MFTIGTVTGIEIWEHLATDVDVKCQPPSVQEAIKPFVMAAPEILRDLLNQKVTLESVMRAKLRFLHHCRYFDYVCKIMDARPECSYGFFSREEMTRALESILSLDIELAEKVASDTNGFLRAQGVNELQLMKNPEGLGLRHDVLREYICGSLTISDLLRRQPEVIVKIG